MGLPYTQHASCQSAWTFDQDTPDSIQNSIIGPALSLVADQDPESKSLSSSNFISIQTSGNVIPDIPVEWWNGQPAPNPPFGGAAVFATEGPGSPPPNINNEDPGYFTLDASLSSTFPGQSSSLEQELTVTGWYAPMSGQGGFSGQTDSHFIVMKGGTRTGDGTSFTATPSWFVRKPTAGQDFDGSDPALPSAGNPDLPAGSNPVEDYHHIHCRVYLDNDTFIDAISSDPVFSSYQYNTPARYTFYAMTYKDGILSVYAGIHGEELSLVARGSVDESNFPDSLQDKPYVRQSSEPLMIGSVLKDLSGNPGEKVVNRTFNAGYDNIAVFNKAFSFDDLQKIFKFGVQSPPPVPSKQGYMDVVNSEVIFSPREPGSIDDGESEEFVLASKMDEVKGGFRLKVTYSQIGGESAQLSPIINWEIQDSNGVVETLSLDDPLYYDSVFLINGGYDINFADAPQISLAAYILKEHGWELFSKKIASSNLTHVGTNNQITCAGSEVKRFFDYTGDWNAEVAPNRSKYAVLYRCAPASSSVSAGQDADKIPNEMFGKGDDLVLADKKLGSADTTYNSNSTNIGSGVIEDNGPFDELEGSVGSISGADRYLAISPYTKRHTAKSIQLTNQHTSSSIDSASYEDLPSGVGVDQTTTIGPGPFIKAKDSDRHTLHNATKFTVMGFYKLEPTERARSKVGGYLQGSSNATSSSTDEYDVDSGGKYGSDGESFGNPVGLDWSSVLTNIGPDGNGSYDINDPISNTYFNAYAPQSWILASLAGDIWKPQTVVDVGAAYLDYPNFRLSNNNAAAALQAPAYRATLTLREVAHFRTIYSNSNNGAIFSFDEDFRYGHRWIGMGGIAYPNTLTTSIWDFSVPYQPFHGNNQGWFYGAEQSALNDKEEFINDALRLNLDRSIYGIRRFLVSACATGGNTLGGVNADQQRFVGATWPFERVRFSKAFRCPFNNPRFVPWTGQTEDGTLRETIEGDIWVNNSRGDMESFCFMNIHRTPPVQGVMVGIDYASKPPRMGVGGVRDLVVGTQPSVDDDDSFRNIGAPAILLCMYSTLDGDTSSEVQSDGVNPVPQTQPLRSYPDDRVDNVYQLMQISAIPQYMYENPWDGTSSNWVGKYGEPQIADPGSDYYPDNVWTFYVLSVDLENQKAFVGAAPVPQKDIASCGESPSADELHSMFDSLGWSKQTGIYLLGHDEASRVASGLTQSSVAQAGPDYGMIARTSKYGVEYDFRFMEPYDNPVPGHRRRRIMLGAPTIVQNGIKIWNPKAIEDFDGENDISTIGMVDPGFMPDGVGAGEPNVMKSELGPGDVPCPADSQDNSNILGDIYTKTTTLGSGPDGHENTLFRGKIGEQLILEDTYVNGDGLQAKWDKDIDEDDYGANNNADEITTEAATDTMALVDALPEISKAVKPPHNTEHIAPELLSGKCAIYSIRVHKEHVVNPDGTLISGLSPASIDIFGYQPHYDMDSGRVLPDEKLTITEFDA